MDDDGDNDDDHDGNDDDNKSGRGGGAGQSARRWCRRQVMGNFVVAIFTQSNTANFYQLKHESTFFDKIASLWN